MAVQIKDMVGKDVSMVTAYLNGACMVDDPNNNKKKTMKKKMYFYRFYLYH